MTTLEKIRAEILFKNRYQFSGYGIDIYLKIDDVLAVLDKYAEQEPCRVKNELNVELNELEPCDDVVRRQAVLKTLDDMDKVLDEERTVENYKELLKECYEVLPSVQPSRMFTDEEIELLGQCLSQHFYMVSGVPQIVLSCMEKLNKLKGDKK